MVKGLERLESDAQTGTSTFCLVGQPGVTQTAREVAAGAVASKEVFLCFAKSAVHLWIGGCFASLHGADVALDRAETIVSKSLFKHALLYHCTKYKIPFPSELPQITVHLEGKESREMVSLLGNADFIPIEPKYRKEVLDQRDSMYFNSSHVFNFDFNNAYITQNLVHKDTEVTIMDTYKEIFVTMGDKLTGAHRKEKCMGAIKSFFKAKKDATLVEKIAVSLFSLKHKIYAAMKYFAI